MNPKPDNNAIDLDYRPGGYRRSPGSLQDLIAQIRGSTSRAMARDLIEQGRGDEVALLAEALTSTVVQMLEARNPAFMGGNYLPALEAGEVEVARITLRSTTADVTAVHARPAEDGWIEYRVVDEYGGEGLPQPSTTRRPGPMTLGEFAEFFLHASGLVSTLRDNHGDDLEQALGFFTVESDFYPGLERLFTTKVGSAFGR